MSSHESQIDAISLLNPQKYDTDVVGRYTEFINRKQKLINQGLMQDRRYKLRSQEQSFKMTEILTINKRKQASNSSLILFSIQKALGLKALFQVAGGRNLADAALSCGGKTALPQIVNVASCGL